MVGGWKMQSGWWTEEEPVPVQMEPPWEFGPFAENVCVCVCGEVYCVERERNVMILALDQVEAEQFGSQSIFFLNISDMLENN